MNPRKNLALFIALPVIISIFAAIVAYFYGTPSATTQEEYRLIPGIVIFVNVLSTAIMTVYWVLGLRMGLTQENALVQPFFPTIWGGCKSCLGNGLSIICQMFHYIFILGVLVLIAIILSTLVGISLSLLFTPNTAKAIISVLLMIMWFIFGVYFTLKITYHSIFTYAYSLRHNFKFLVLRREFKEVSKNFSKKGIG
ncbi:MAG: hypothetical protein J6Y94_07445, partial [Bacteriovoracaceae bacterium]|nr:hypothetical protein [Bacteriovoracaceae bacterium]